MQFLIHSGDLGPSWFHVSIRALVLLSKSDTLLKSHVIAKTLEVEPTYIRKILASLTKAELVTAYSGRYGGYTLSKKASEITIGDVYRAPGAGQSTPYWSVPNTGTEKIISLVLSKAEEQFQSVLSAYSIEDIVRQGIAFDPLPK
ncbi:Rrf2 family transcriptional regulator [Paenibacillus sp. sgz302251]|uniref:Rrf2 family transcriptional regulator n=1 Tax=Paenibacillus sp. sgz302251 TaxID=3414493 RepID=UPI003C7D9C26